ncbi:hypothetical protein A0H81_10899 [Grifola frondosa]|uniref:Uncharacterized protein n=1 Tax=Grifola frondosa TaxID=5627 RepID=A0A1C7LY38_GRIFR|nr:hypothetical protein A0H81_10899 [Grifola frondosa]
MSHSDTSSGYTPSARLSTSSGYSSPRFGYPSSIFSKYTASTQGTTSSVSTRSSGRGGSGNIRKTSSDNDNADGEESHSPNHGREPNVNPGRAQTPGRQGIGNIVRASRIYSAFKLPGHLPRTSSLVSKQAIWRAEYEKRVIEQSDEAAKMKARSSGRGGLGNISSRHRSGKPSKKRPRRPRPQLRSRIRAESFKGSSTDLEEIVEEDRQEVPHKEQPPASSSAPPLHTTTKNGERRRAGHGKKRVRSLARVLDKLTLQRDNEDAAATTAEGAEFKGMTVTKKQPWPLMNRAGVALRRRRVAVDSPETLPVISITVPQCSASSADTSDRASQSPVEDPLHLFRLSPLHRSDQWSYQAASTRSLQSSPVPPSVNSDVELVPVSCPSLGPYAPLYVVSMMWLELAG